MKRSTVTLAAGLILTAAAIKLAFPAKTGQEVYTSGSAQTADVSAAESGSTMPVVVTINAGELLSGTEDSTEESVQLPPAVEEAIETFLESQEPFEDLAIPADVTYEAELPDFEYVSPVAAECSSGFGYRVHPLENLTKFHYGTDLAAQSGDDIHCFADGTVTEVGQNETMGKFIRVSHADGYASLYAHCGTVYVAKGQSVAAGEKLGLVGSSGKVTGPHLHFELTKNGVFLNPAFCLAAL
jgi:murein DD-endopeptidase MepM/ murein hydrolase activator NlpD